jgi:uncharacterized protein (DUF362 family)
MMGTAALGVGHLVAPLAEAADGPADMTIAKWTGPKDLSAEGIKQAAVKLTEQAIAGLGGLKRFMGQGAVVWVKPNIGWDRTPEQAANTNPDVVATIVRMCFEAGAKKVKVGDNPCDKAPATYKASAIADAVRDLGAEVVFLDRNRFRETAIGGERVKTIPVYPEILECDLLINVPVVKHHRLAKATLCMKNFMGVIEKRNVFHQAIEESLVDLNRFLKPRLSILDAVRILVANGPKGGRLEDVQTKLTIAAGTDVVALDAWGAEVMGLKPDEVKSVVAGDKAGLGKADYRSLRLKEAAVS